MPRDAHTVGGTIGDTLEIIVIWGVGVPLYLAYSGIRKLVVVIKDGLTPVTAARERQRQERNAEKYAGAAVDNLWLYSRPLIPGSKQIRLLILLPTTGRGSDDRVRCEIMHTDWDATKYEALSYAWGNPTLCRRIEISHGDTALFEGFMVTENLYAALKSLRRGSPRALWIDAICINQLDNEERGDQVNQMRHIYESAMNVIAWLGNTPKGFRRLLVASETPTVWLDMSMEAPLRELLQRPWWTRSWVIQEVVLAKYVFFQCGTHRIEWDPFFKLVQQLEQNQNRDQKISNPGTDQMISNARNMMWIREGWMESIDPPLGLLGMAWTFREREVSDVRDRLYALLSLLPPEDVIISPDYSKSQDQIFGEFARAWIICHKSLLIMNLAQWQPENRHAWYPVWPEPFLHTTELFFGADFSVRSQIFWDDKFSADGGLSPEVFLHVANKDILHLRGFSCDTVAAISTLCKARTDGDWSEILAEWREFAFEDTNLGRSKLEDEFCLAITAGLGSMSEGYEKVRDLACRSRRLFRTHGGRLGLGPAHMTEGDQVCVLLGSPVPLVLSECKTCRLDKERDYMSRNDESRTSVSGIKGGSTVKGDYLQTSLFVGDAYVHDFMNYDGDICADIQSGQLQLEDFYFCG